LWPSFIKISQRWRVEVPVRDTQTDRQTNRLVFTARLCPQFRTPKFGMPLSFNPCTLPRCRSIRISRRASCCCSSATAGIAIGPNFKIYLLRQFCSNGVYFFTIHKRHRHKKWWTRILKLKFCDFWVFFEIFKKASRGDYRVSYTLQLDNPSLPQNCPFLRGSGPRFNTCFPWPTRDLNPNGIWIGSTIFAGLTMWQNDRQTHRPTDHATQSVTIGHIYIRSIGVMWPNNTSRIYSVITALQGRLNWPT